MVSLVLSSGCYAGLPADDGGAAGQTGGEDGTEGGSGDDGNDVPEELLCDGEVADPGPSLVRRLTVDEYVETIRAVLGVDIEADARSLLPAELRADGFSNTASGLITTLKHVEAYETLAQTVVSQIPDFEGFVASHAGCTDFSDTCERALIESVGHDVYRRPLRPGEVDALLPAFAIAKDEGETFTVGAGLVLEAMLQSPPFLYRLEDELGDDTGVRVLDSYEVASRLSYLVWGGPPDDDLYAAAAGNALATDEEITAQVDRMLEDPRARAASLRFYGDWLHLGRLENLPRNPERFPNWTTSIGQAMRAETLAFFEAIALDQQRPLTELFTAQETWLLPELAAYYGLQSPAAEGVAHYDLTDIPERGGLLTQGSLLTIGGDNASMVSRGLFVLETLLCGHLASPPPGVDTTVPPIEPGKSQRSYSEERTNNPSCAGCHLQIEPIAWGLERFLADGTYATQDWLGNELREDGFVQLAGQEAIPFQTVAEMMDILGESEQVQACFGEKNLQYALGRALLEGDACAMEGIAARFAESQGTWRDLVLAVALSPTFRTIRVEAAQ